MLLSLPKSPRANKTVVTLTRVLVTAVSLSLASCAFSKPRPATDSVYMAAFQKERQFWEKRAAQVYCGMTRQEVDRILPKDTSLSGILGGGKYFQPGKTRPQGHTEEWYYLSPHFVCSIEYDFTGLNYEPAQFLFINGDVPYHEFPEPSAPGSDKSQNRVLGSPTITLVEPGRVKKVRP